MITASARHILVNDEQHCLQLKTELASGADFGLLAEQHSNCPSKLQGGALGSFSRGQMVKEFDDVVFTAELHTVQGPIKTQFGYHLIEVTNRTDK
ncbi:peptidylprolyl isomerase [Thalassotalea sp. PP2-459]|uniref:peptidylprolyl isomerase n=1 Tax=Thalassotalea sp. PP2-459 TaxID=1742724 RepID=UPI00094548FA|nr:peptidylprolyl isomerase [Thalassotalea sp. PP2-459]OKY25939.1 peptidylprolyl isomerase [Thalassotalea sp. PP2-459]